MKGGGDKTQGLHNFGLGGNKRESTDMGGGRLKFK